MLVIRVEQPLDRLEAALRGAAQRHNANVLSVVHLGQLLRVKEPSSSNDAIVYTICRPDLSAALLAADIRFAAFIPCRVAAFESGGAVMLEALTPSEMCSILERPDLAGLAAELEATLRGILEEAAKPAETHPHRAARSLTLGATEEQVYARGMVPQRIDCHGTKVEELAGTGQHDSSGG